MEKYIAIRFQKQTWQDCKSGRKRYRGFYSQKQHNRRLEKQDKNYLINPQYTHLNIFKDFLNVNQIDKKLEEVYKDYKQYHKRKLPSNTKPFINGLITFSDTITKDLELKNKVNRQKFFTIIEGFIKEEVGNIISLDFHIDETTPHFHFTCINYDFDNHITYARIISDSIKSNKNKQNFQQDRLEQYLKKHIKNFDYKRGKILSKKQYLNDRQKHKQHLEKQVNQINQYTHIINEITQDLEQLGKHKDLQKFKKLVDRYFKNDTKLERLLTKWKKATKTNITNLQKFKQIV